MTQMKRVDIREVMKFYVPYTEMGGKCSYCEVTEDTVTVKEHWANQPLGHMIVRCPEHMAYAEASWLGVASETHPTVMAET